MIVCKHIFEIIFVQFQIDKVHNSCWSDKVTMTKLRNAQAELKVGVESDTLSKNSVLRQEHLSTNGMIT